MEDTLELLSIDRFGVAAGRRFHPGSAAEAVLTDAVAHYHRHGFSDPWVRYLAVVSRAPVGCCGFQAAPLDGCVEIVFRSLPGFERRGYAVAMVAHLIAIAVRASPSMRITAHTACERNAMHRVLERVGFHIDRQLERRGSGPALRWARVADTPAGPIRDVGACLA